MPKKILKKTTNTSVTIVAPIKSLVLGHSTRESSILTSLRN